MKNRYMFVRVHYDKRVASLEPLGLEYLVACVKAEKHKAFIHDESITSPFMRFKQVLDKVDRNGVTIVGFTIMSNMAWYILDMIHKLKQARPRVKVIVGGPEVNINYRDFCLDDIDYISYDNGLDSFRTAVRNEFDTEVLRSCSGIAFKDKGEWIVNEKGAPISNYGIRPDRTQFFKNKRKYRVIAKGCFSVLKTSFSCPQQCKFCISRQFNSCTYKERPIDDVVDEIISLDNDKIFIIDDDFLLNRERVKEICKRLIKAGCKKTFMVFSRADSIVRCRDLMKLIYKAGFRDFLVGLEAVEDTTLEKYNKHSSVEMNRQAVQILRENRMLCVGLFVINYDFGHRDFMKINEFIKREGLIWVLFSILIPFKGTAVYEENKDRLYRYKYRRTDGTHVLMRPSKLPMWLFEMEFRFLYYVNYPRIYWAGLTNMFNRRYKNR